MKMRVLATIVAIAITTGDVVAQDDQPAVDGSQTQPPETYLSLIECRGISSVQDRVACYDTHIGLFAEAEQRGDLIIIEKREVEKAQRGLFGFKLPQVGLLGERKDRPGFEAIDHLESSIADARQIGRGKWRVRLEDGALWDQIDNRSLYRKPEKGDRVIINRGSFGSFLVKIGNNGSIRMRRVE